MHLATAQGKIGEGSVKQVPHEAATTIVDDHCNQLRQGKRGSEKSFPSVRSIMQGNYDDGRASL